jgi:hypothetical protein
VTVPSGGSCGGSELAAEVDDGREGSHSLLRYMLATDRGRALSPSFSRRFALATRSAFAVVVGASRGGSWSLHRLSLAARLSPSL